MNFPRLRKIAHDKNDLVPDLKQEINDALAIIDVFMKLDAQAHGLVSPKANSRSKSYIVIEEYEIRFEITAEQREAIERVEKATKFSEID